MDEVVIRLCGAFALTRAGVATPVTGHKARLLLARLAVVQGQVLTAAEMVDALWPGNPPLRAVDNVATLVSRVRGVLGHGVVRGGRAGYRLGDPPVVRVDLVEAAELAADAARRVATDPAVAMAAASRGAELLGDGRILVGEPDSAWVAAARAEAEVRLRSLRHTVAEAALAVGDPAAAADAARAAATADPLDERGHRLLIAAHHAAGEQDRALAVYERLRAALADGLGVHPDAETRSLHVTILRGDRARSRPAARTRADRPGPAPPGRETELAVLSEAWSDAAGGTAAAVLLTGEPGIGKTTLAESAAELASRTGGTVLRARCYAAERSLFLQPVLDALGPELRGMPPAALRRMAGAGAGALAGLLPDLAALLGGTDGGPPSPELYRRQAYDAVRAVLGGLAAERPVLLLLDDLHNAGVATVELLHYVLRRAAGSRVLTLLTVRADEGSEAIAALADVARRVPVGPLPPDAVALLASRSGVPRLADDILRRTGGHTLFVVETLRGIVAGERGVPDSLQSAVLGRVQRVGPDVEKVLRAGAVLGATLAPDTVAALIDAAPAEVVRRCEQATAARLLVPAGDGYEFANDLVQEVLHASTPVPVRTAHHRRAAGLLADRPEAAALHAAAVGDWTHAARAWLVAGEQATDRYAAADGMALLDRALAATERIDDPLPAGYAHLARARAHELLGDFPAAVDDLRAALAAARAGGDRRLEMAALRQYAGDVCSALGLPEREHRLDDALLIAVELGDRAAEADLCGWQAVVATNRLRFTDAVTLGRRAVAAGRAAGDDGAGDDGAVAAGLDGLKTAYAYLGDGAALGPVLRELEPVLRRRGELQRLAWTVFESALPAVAAADWDAATGLVDEALEINRRSGLTTHTPWFVAHRGWVERLRGRLDEAAEQGRRAVALSLAASHPWWRPAATALLASTLLELGDTAGATRALSDVVALAERGGTESYVLRCLAPLAEATGDPEVLHRADALLSGIDAPAGGAWFAGGDAYLAVARAWLARGEAARARAALAPLRAAAERARWLPWQASAALVDGTALAALGEHDAAESRFRQVVRLAGEHDMPHLAARAGKLVTAAEGWPPARG